MTDMEKIIDPPHYEIIPPGTYPDGLEYMDIMEYVLGNRTYWVKYLSMLFDLAKKIVLNKKLKRLNGMLKD
jgi:hypothetical protein